MKRILLYILFLCSSVPLFSQEKDIEGIVFDADSKQRLSRVYIYNTRTEKGFYNNTKGEFSTRAASGDVLVAALPGYGVDTITVRSQTTILFYLKRNSILLQEVTVRDSLLSPDQRRAQNEVEFKDAYRKGDASDILNINSRGAGLGIDALWSLLSREGKNARYLQKILEQDYRDLMINYRFTRPLVSRVTGLTGDALKDFMEQYRPSYYFVLEANDYNLIQFIQASYQKYKRSPAANRLPPLVP